MWQRIICLGFLRMFFMLSPVFETEFKCWAKNLRWHKNVSVQVFAEYQRTMSSNFEWRQWNRNAHRGSITNTNSRTNTRAHLQFVLRIRYFILTKTRSSWSEHTKHSNSGGSESETERLEQKSEKIPMHVQWQPDSHRNEWRTFNSVLCIQWLSREYSVNKWYVVHICCIVVVVNLTLPFWLKLSKS